MINYINFEYILKYLYAIQNIAAYKADTMDYMTPYGLETRRQEAHNQMVQKVIMSIITVDDETEVYIRTKDITDNLDKVWAIYDSSDFDMLNDGNIPMLATYLEKLFYSSECKNFLEGKTAFLRGIHIPK